MPARYFDADSKKYVLSVVLANEPGALARVIGLFSGRGYNLRDVNVGEINRETSRLTIVCRAPAKDRMMIDQIMSQIKKLIQVQRVRDLTDDPDRVDVRVSLIRVDVLETSTKKRAEVRRVVEEAGALVVLDRSRFITIRHEGAHRGDFQTFARKLRKFGDTSVVRGGMMSIGGRNTAIEAV